MELKAEMVWTLKKAEGVVLGRCELMGDSLW